MKGESIKKPYHLQGGSHFSYIAVNYHPESENLLKNLTTHRAAVSFLTLQQTSLNISKKGNLNRSFQLVCITCKKERPFSLIIVDRGDVGMQ